MFLPADPVSKDRAEMYAHRVQTYWHARGHTHVMVFAMPTRMMGFGEVWIVRSNLVCGLPPEVKH